MKELASIYTGSYREGRPTVSPAVLRTWRYTSAFAGAESAIADSALIDVRGSVAMRGIGGVTPELFDLLGNIQCSTLAASWRPAREAMRLDPVQLLREE